MPVVTPRNHDPRLFVLTAFAIVTDGLVYAAYLFLVAVGLTLIFGVMKILNVTHGSFYAFGAYGAATAAGIWFDKGLPDAGGFLFMVIAGHGDRPRDRRDPRARHPALRLRQGRGGDRPRHLRGVPDP